jgi:hypothetical protein
MAATSTELRLGQRFCGPARRPGDGLRILPGPVARRPLWAAPWTPDPSVDSAGGTVRPEVVWAARDCPSGLAASSALLGPRGQVPAARTVWVTVPRPPSVPATGAAS